MITEELLFTRCSRFLKVSKQVYDMTGKKILMYKGSNKLPVEEVIKFKPRSAPMNTNMVIHNAANEFFKEKFGIALRTDSVFATTDKATTLKYGEPFYMVPVGNFSFYSSLEINDMYFSFNSQRIYSQVAEDKELSKEEHDELYSKFEEDPRNFNEYLCDARPDLIERYVKSKLDDANYVKNKVASLVSPNELMVVCNEYILLPVNERYKDFFDEVVYGL